MSTVGQFSRTDSLPFKDGSFICILDLIDLVMQIQRFQKPNVSHHKQGKMFPFSSLVIKVWRAKPKYSHLVFLAFLASIMQITLVKSSRRHGVDRHAQIAYRLKKET